MLLKFYLLLFQCLIFYSRYTFGNPKALIGKNVRQTNAKEFPFVVAIMRTNKENSQSGINYICTGSLISLKDVLTAEHCFESETLTGIYVIGESHDLRLGKKYYIIWWITYNQWINQKKIHAEYEENDIAVARLLQSFPQKITPAIISNMLGVDFIGYDVVIPGWGVSNTGVNPNIMEVITVTVQTSIQCRNIIEHVIKRKIIFDSRLLCTIAKPYGLIQAGDSGGPLIYRGSIIAINRSTCPNTEQNDFTKKVNLHLSIDYYRLFITDVKMNYR